MDFSFLVENKLILLGVLAGFACIGIAFYATSGKGSDSAKGDK